MSCFDVCPLPFKLPDFSNEKELEQYTSSLLRYKRIQEEIIQNDPSSSLRLELKYFKHSETYILNGNGYRGDEK